MTMRQLVGVMSVFVLVVQGSTVHAQHGGGSTLPSGRPFQILQASIQSIDAALAAQIADLQAQLNANAANDAAQSQLIGALQVAVASFEIRLAGAQLSIEQLNQYNALHQELFQQQTARINSLQTQVAGQTSAIQGFGSQLTTLFNLHNQQQSVIAATQNLISFLGSQVNANLQQIANLSTQHAVLVQQYQTTRSWLATGCPPNFSIRQVGANGGVNCEPDTSVSMSRHFAGPVVTVAPGGSAVSEVFCPSSSLLENWTATGGGFAMSPGVVLRSQQSGNGWHVAFYNPNPGPIQANATVTCTLSR